VLNQRRAALNQAAFQLIEKIKHLIATAAKSTQRQYEDLAQKFSELSMPRLLELYFEADKNQYQTETGLSDNEIESLHQELANYIAIMTQVHQIEQSQAALENCLNKGKMVAAMKNLYCFRLAQKLFASPA
jgi:hypothetical protein